MDEYLVKQNQQFKFEILLLSFVVKHVLRIKSDKDRIKTTNLKNQFERED